VREILLGTGSSAEIEVDGGVDVSRAAQVVAAGASILVAGEAIFDTPDPEATARVLRAAAVEAAIVNRK